MQYFTFLLLISIEIIAVNYDGYKVFQVLPEKNYHLRILKSFYFSPDIDFWYRSSNLNHPTIIMVKPKSLQKFQRTMKSNHFKYNEIMDNLASYLENNSSTRKYKDVSENDFFSLDKYNTYNAIKSYLENLQIEYPEKVSVFSIGKTAEKRDILVIKISKTEENKPVILIDAGIHAREWIAPATALYLIHQLTKNEDNDEMLQNVNWYIVPLLNPDGYDYSQRVDRLWRKNRAYGRYCTGVDPNRNYDFHWMEGGSSDDECSEVYAGYKPFSEQETRSLRNFVLKQKNKIKLYITLHSFGQYILYPWNYTPKGPADEANLEKLARSVSKTIENIFGSKYEYGTSNTMLYLATGNSEDWMKGIAGINYSFAMELPAGGVTGFDVPEQQIMQISRETFEGFRVFAKFVSSTWN